MLYIPTPLPPGLRDYIVDNVGIVWASVEGRPDVVAVVGSGHSSFLGESGWGPGQPNWCVLSWAGEWGGYGGCMGWG